MGTAERRQRERERKEREIIEAARELFFKKGYDSTSVDEVAERLELSKGTIYLYFANKEEIYYAVARDGLLIARDMFEKALSGPGNGLERLTAIGQAYIEFWTTQPEYRRLFHNSKLKTLPQLSGPRGEDFVRAGADINGLMLEAIRQGMEDGSIRQDVRPELLAFVGSSMVDGILDRLEKRGLEQTGGREREEALSYAFDLIRQAVASPVAVCTEGSAPVPARAKSVKRKR